MKEKRLKKIYNALLVFAFFNAIVLFIIYRNPDFKINLVSIVQYKNLIVKGYITTILISIVSLIITLIFSIALFFMSISKKLYLNYFYNCFTQIALGVPLIVHVLVLYFFFTSAIGIKSPLIAGTLILSGYMSAYFAKTFEGAYKSIDEQQFKIMHILQLPNHIRFKKIIIPQIIRDTLPSLTSHFSLLVKSTALLSVISVPEFTNYINTFNSKSFQFVTGYIMLAFGYLFITIPLSYLAKWLNEEVVNKK